MTFGERGSWRGPLLRPLSRRGSSCASALALTAAQAGLTDWLFCELVGMPPLSERCIFPGGSGTFMDPEESSSAGKSAQNDSTDSSKPGENPVCCISGAGGAWEVECSRIVMLDRSLGVVEPGRGTSGGVGRERLRARRAAIAGVCARARHLSDA